MDLQLQFDGVTQPLQIVALDGVPTGSQDGTRRGKLVTKSDILIPPAGRAEFIVSGPSVQVKHATFLTLAIDTGPGGDNDPQRPLASIHPSDDAAPALAVIRAPSGRVNPQRFEGLDDEPVTARRKLYFSELLSDPKQPGRPDKLLHHSRWGEAGAVRPQCSACDHHSSGCGRRLDNREPHRRTS
jgi:hypothetical protein